MGEVSHCPFPIGVHGACEERESPLQEDCEEEGQTPEHRIEGVHHRHTHSLLSLLEELAPFRCAHAKQAGNKAANERREEDTCKDEGDWKAVAKPKLYGGGVLFPQAANTKGICEPEGVLAHEVKEILCIHRPFDREAANNTDRLQVRYALLERHPEGSQRLHHAFLLAARATEDDVSEYDIEGDAHQDQDKPHLHLRQGPSGPPYQPRAQRPHARPIRPRAHEPLSSTQVSSLKHL
eukprot:CAMPEP_0178373986 /NCGR_PEP_ID=MMETSP0689_2-20121128/2145_1 /TAXON_ID=160604 /ORGANISM="Amphidinium massartii, Strain CS-259" /LENGTH=236 /DNA_ID=CAMNT_0019993945 /DNA_START=1286 /DNA_END=1996 /DNA_ORIENTATION=+